MPLVHIEANLSTEQLLQAVKQLEPDQLETFATKILALRAGQQAPAASAVESELLLKINEALPTKSQHRYEELIAKRQAESLTPADHQELLRLGDEMERKEVDRLQALKALADLRRIPLRDLMNQLGLNGRQMSESLSKGDLNREGLVNLRQILFAAGEHPPRYNEPGTAP